MIESKRSGEQDGQKIQASGLGDPADVARAEVADRLEAGAEVTEVEALKPNELPWQDLSPSTLIVVIDGGGGLSQRESEVAATLEKQWDETRHRQVGGFDCRFGQTPLGHALVWVKAVNGNETKTRGGVTKPLASAKEDLGAEQKFAWRYGFQKVTALLADTYAATELVVWSVGQAGQLGFLLAQDLLGFSGNMQSPNRWQSLKLRSYESVGAGDLPVSKQLLAGLGYGQRMYRRWVNESPHTMTSLKMIDELASFALRHQLPMQVLDENSLQQAGLNLLLAVGAGSERSPSRLIILHYHPDQVVRKQLQKGLSQAVDQAIRGQADGEGRLSTGELLIGKGITFDTGGINVKSFEGYVNTMQNDMGGAALMAALFCSLVEAKHHEPVTLIVPACENAIDSHSMPPGSVYRSHSGHTVCVEHTDAEGRLILADAISFGQSLCSPRHTWVAATLTTAALRAHGGYTTPAYFVPEDCRAQLQEAADRFGELLQFHSAMPMFSNANQSVRADLTNMGRLPSRGQIGAGSQIAAHFLQEFAVKPLTHFDIFNTTWNWGGDYPGATPGATGALFSTLLSFFSKRSHTEPANRPS